MLVASIRLAYKELLHLQCYMYIAVPLALGLAPVDFPLVLFGFTEAVVASSPS